DFDPLLFGNRQRPDGLMQIDGEAERVGMLPDVTADLGKPAPVASARTGKHDIFDGIEPVHQLEVLMNHSHAMSYRIARTRKHTGHSIDEKCASISRIKAGRNVH